MSPHSEVCAWWGSYRKTDGVSQPNGEIIEYGADLCVLVADLGPSEMLSGV